MSPAKLNESYRYGKYFDNGFLRDTLLEHYAPDEVHDAVPEYEISWQDTSGKQRFKIPFCYSTNGREYRAAMKDQERYLVSRRPPHHQHVESAAGMASPGRTAGYAGQRSANKISGLPKIPE